MFDLGFTKKDLIRSAWVFGITFISVFGTLVTGAGAFGSWEEATAAAAALVPAALATAFIAAKNFLLADGSPLKG